MFRQGNCQTLTGDTVSSLLNNPPQSFPTGTGREPWESMKTFLSNPEEKAKLLDQLKARKGEHLTDFTLRYKKQKKQASEYLENEQGKANRQGKQQKARKLRRQRKRHERFLTRSN